MGIDGEDFDRWTKALWPAFISTVILSVGLFVNISLGQSGIIFIAFLVPILVFAFTKPVKSTGHMPELIGFSLLPGIVLLFNLSFIFEVFTAFENSQYQTFRSIVLKLFSLAFGKEDWAIQALLLSLVCIAGVFSPIFFLAGLSAFSKKDDRPDRIFAPGEKGGKLVSKADFKHWEKEILSKKGRVIPLYMGVLGSQKFGNLVAYPLEAMGLIVGPSRTGKGNFMITNLLVPRPEFGINPVVVLDPKSGENAMVTIRRRREFLRKCVILSPDDCVARTIKEEEGELASRYFASGFINPIESFIRKDDEDNTVEDVELILKAISIRTAKDTNSHFTDMAEKMLRALLIYVAVDKNFGERSFQQVAKVLNSSDEEREAHIEQMRTYGDSFAGLVSEEGKSWGNRATHNPEHMSDIIASAERWLINLIKSPRLQNFMSKTTVDLEELADGNTDFYIACSADRAGAYKPILRMLTVMLLAVAERKRLSKRVLFLVDEASELGKLDAIESAFKIKAGAGYSVVLATQTLESLQKEYGSLTVADMITNSQIFCSIGSPSTNPKLLEMLSKATPEERVIEKSQSRSSSERGLQTSYSDRESRRHMYSPGEIAELPNNAVFAIDRSKKAGGKNTVIKTVTPRYFEIGGLKEMADPNHLALKG